MNNKYLFIDRDGTLIKEPESEQIDTIEQVEFLPGVFSALRQLVNHNYRLVMVSNQDGLGSAAYPEENFVNVQRLILSVFASQQIYFDDVLICPHVAAANCSCRKPAVGLLMPYLIEQSIDTKFSAVIGDRDSDIALANNLAIKGMKIDQNDPFAWQTVTRNLLQADRSATIERTTNETQISCQLNLDASQEITINTGIGFFDHMLEQLFYHANVGIKLTAKGDLTVDAHHTVEDVAIVIGQALKQCLRDKIGIARYGFSLPMDDALATANLDLSGRSYCAFNADFTVPNLGDLPTEMIEHFFDSLSRQANITLRLTVSGKNNHHCAEALFKVFGRALGQAKLRQGQQLPTTKGVLC